jgi:Brp/Blh family beta-carotene 15,15'-monooxygenase
LIAIAIPAFHTEEVVAIFSILVGDTGAQSLISIIAAVLKPYLLIVIAYLLYSIKNDKWRITAANLVVLLLIAYWAAPLVSFAVYFCLWHSRSHTLRIWHSIDAIHRRRCLLEAAAYSILTWLTAAVCFWYFRMTPDAALIQLTFIGLAALTVPHMLLVDFADSKLHRLMA